MVTLTKQQDDAARFVLDSIKNGERVVAIRGLAGTGKSTLIPELRQRLIDSGVIAMVSSPTNKGVAVLGSKGILGARTVCSLIYAVSIDDELRTLRELFLQGLLPKRWVNALDLPDATLQAPTDEAFEGFKARLKGMLRNGGKSLSTYANEKTYGDQVLIVDEASMLSAQDATVALGKFAALILVGDHGQLAPVQGKPILDTVPGATLTEIHRQAADNPIIKLAYDARKGGFPQILLKKYAGSEEIGTLTGKTPRGELPDYGPIIVWTNGERKALNEQITIARHKVEDILAADVGQLEGMQIVIRENVKNGPGKGLCNNQMAVILGESKHNRGWITLQPDGWQHPVDVPMLHWEDYEDSDDKGPGAVSVRAGWAVTAHTAQGGEWSSAVVSLKSWSDMTLKLSEQQVSQWAYTAITRAKAKLYILK